MHEVNKINDVARFLVGEMTEMEQKAFSEWIDANETNRLFYEDTRALWELTERYETVTKKEIESFDGTDSWDRFEEKFQAIETNDVPIKEWKTSVEPKRRGIIKQLMQAAAVLLIGIGMGYVILQNQTDPTPEMVVYQSGANEKEEFTLPDGTKIWMNERSKIEYIADFKPRLLSFEGEAFFEVAHQDGNPFEIRSGDTKTIVLGTSFNVRAYPDESFVEVAVETGKVAFQQKEKIAKSLILEPGDAGVFRAKEKTLLKSTEPNVNKTSWRKKELIFDDTPLSEVIPALERYFGKRIKMSSVEILNCHITGTYKEPTLSELLDVLAYSLDINVEKEKDHFILVGYGCDPSPLK